MSLQKILFQVKHGLWRLQWKGTGRKRTSVHASPSATGPAPRQGLLGVHAGITAKNTESLPCTLRGETMYFLWIDICPIPDTDFWAGRVTGPHLLSRMKTRMKKTQNLCNSRTLDIRPQRALIPEMRHIPGESQLTAWRKGQATRQGPGSPNRAKGQVEPVGQSKREERGQKEKPRDLRRLPPEYLKTENTALFQEAVSGPFHTVLGKAPALRPWLLRALPQWVRFTCPRSLYKWHHTISLLWGRGGFFCSPQSFVALISNAFCFFAEQCSTVWIYHHSVDGRLSCFPFFGYYDKAAMNILV